MTKQDDLRYLATIDTRHKRLSRATDAGLSRYTIDVQRDTDDNPVVAIAMQKEVCPVDPQADWQIAYWVVDVRLNSVVPELTRSIAAIRRAMVDAGSKRLWGFVPNEGVGHLKAFLDPLVDAGLVTKIDGREAGEEFRLVAFYIGDRDTLASYIEGAS